MPTRCSRIRWAWWPRSTPWPRLSEPSRSSRDDAGMEPGELLLLTGSPGSGKTTVAPLVADHADPSVCCDLDWFFAKLRRGAIDPWLHEAHQQNRTVLGAAASAMA